MQNLRFVCLCVLFVDPACLAAQKRLQKTILKSHYHSHKTL